MTKEEAIDTLSKVETMLKLYPKKRKQKGTVNQLNKAIDMAIKSLQAEADCSTCKHKDKGWDSEECDSCCGNNNHYAPVEAEPTQTEKCDWCIHNDTYKDKMTCKECVSADAIQGEWIKKPHRKYLPMDCPWPDGEDYDEETHSCTVYHWHCSCCDYDMHEFMKPWYNYCPNCGARMYKGGAE